MSVRRKTLRDVGAEYSLDELRRLLLLVLLASATVASSDEIDQDYVAHREKALRTTATELHTDEHSDKAFGLVVDFRISQMIVTVVVLKNGEVSMYNSKGGIRSGGARISEEIRNAAEQALSLATAEIPHMKKASDLSVLTSGQMRAYVLTPAGILCDEADAANVNADTPVRRLVAAVDPVITGYRHLETNYEKAP